VIKTRREKPSSGKTSSGISFAGISSAVYSRRGKYGHI